MPSRFLFLLLSVAAAGVGGWLAAHHPLGQPAPLVVFALTVALAWRWPDLWLVALPAAVPLIGLAPWSGWISFEETDLLVLAIAGGCYARLALERNAPSAARPVSRLLVIVAAGTAAAIVIALARGFADAGGFQFGWYQGYDGPMNSLRIGKSFFLALLLVPLIDRHLAKPDGGATTKLALGLAAGLATASLATLWERLAFTDLLNFSSDYRTTGAFWEMHVGGAALDGWLVLTAPFAVWALRRARTHMQWAGAAALLALAAYGSLTTFSRGVYLALPVALGCLAWGLSRQRPAGAPQAPPRWGLTHWALAVVVVTIASGLIFPSSGYRGLLALLGLIALALPLPGTLGRQTSGNVALGAGAGFLAGIALAFLADFLPKGPYLLYAVSLAFSLACVLANSAQPAPAKAAGLAGGFAATCILAPAVAWNWGGEKALWDFLGAEALVLLPVVVATARHARRWPAAPRPQATAFLVAAAVCGATSIFGGGAYMGERFSTASQDLSGRTEHWRLAAAMLSTPGDLVFGKGLGRFPANYFFAIPNAAFPGTYRWMHDGTTAFVKLTGARHPVSFGDLFRVSQRLPPGTQGPFSATITARAGAAASLHLEVCEKHLLYAAVCSIGKANLAAGNEWQTLDVRFEGQPFPAGPWYAPRIKVFSIGVGSEGRIVDVAAIALKNAEGLPLLANGDFSQEMAHWFFSSDRDHMPWHAKSIVVNILFDQGLFGLVMFASLALAALWRLSFGRARHDPLAPYLAAGIAGFLTVGIFDSLLDVPRLALLFYLTTLTGMTLAGGRPPRKTRKTPRRAQPAT